MRKIATTGRRVLKGNVWHDDNGEIPGSPADWSPPMTVEEKHAAAMSDPDNPPLTPEQLARFKRVPAAKRIRHKLGMSQEAFADRFHIPLGTLRDWEQHRAEPDQAARAYLQVIEREPAAVERALMQAAE